jgi:hypothetical protein
VADVVTVVMFGIPMLAAVRSTILFGGLESARKSCHSLLEVFNRASSSVLKSRQRLSSNT